jgi:GTP-binding protein
MNILLYVVIYLLTYNYYDRLIIHLIRGDSEDPINDFLGINQELELFNPKLANMTQVVVINKIDIPEVRNKLSSLIKQIQSLCGHTRIMGISAITKENVKELMQRVKKVVDTLPKQSDYELFTEEENRVNFEMEEEEDFDILTDERYPHQFRVVGTKIEKV